MHLCWAGSILDRWQGWQGYPPKNQTCSGRETSTYLLLLSQILSFRKGTAKEQNGSVIDPRFLESQPVRVEIRWDRLVIRLRFDRTKRGVESRTRSAPSKVAVPRLGGTARYCHPSPEKMHGPRFVPSQLMHGTSCVPSQLMHGTSCVPSQLMHGTSFVPSQRIHAPLPIYHPPLHYCSNVRVGPPQRSTTAPRSAPAN